MGDRGDIVLGWLTKLVLVLAVLGVIGFDLISLGTARLAAEDHAQDAARVAAATYRDNKDLQAAYDAAVAEALQHGDTVEAPTFAVTAESGIALTLHRTASTLLVEKIAPLRKWAEIEVSVTGRPPA